MSRATSSSARLLVVMPAWNEQDALPATIAEVRAALPEAHLVVVDDGSTDATALVARTSGADVLQLPFNLGVGGAVRAGYRYAVRHGYDVVVQVDADGQHDPSDVPALVDALEKADVVIGARFADPGSQYEASPVRRLTMRLLAVVISLVARRRLTDTTSGFKAVNARAAAFYSRNFPAEYLGDTVEALVLGARAGLRLTEVPVEMRQRRAGTPSHSPWKASIYLVRALVALGMALVRRVPHVSGEDA